MLLGMLHFKLWRFQLVLNVAAYMLVSCCLSYSISLNAYIAVTKANVVIVCKLLTIEHQYLCARKQLVLCAVRRRLSKGWYPRAMVYFVVHTS